VELEVPSNVSQGEHTEFSSSKGHIKETNTNSPDILSSEELQTSDRYSISHDRPQRATRKPTHYSTDGEHGLIANALAVAQEITEGIEPSTYSEVISYPNSSNWLMAMQEEIESLHKNNTWELCELPNGHHALTAK